MNEFNSFFTRIYPYFLFLLVVWMIFLIFKLRHSIFNSGFIKIKKRNYDEAVDDFKKQLQKDSDKGYCYYGLGWCYYMLGFHQHAIRNFQLAIEHKFKEIESFFLMAILYSEENNFDKAYGIIKKANKVQKKKVIFDKLTKFQINEMIGWIYFQKNDHDIAISYYNKAIPRWEKYSKKFKLLPEKFSPVYYRIGIIYKIQGDNQKAKEYFENSIKSSPNSIFSEKSKSELEKMKN